MYSTWSVIESQPDWITAGAHTRPSLRALEDLAKATRQDERSTGEQERPWRLLGYEGWKCGRVRYGETRGWALLQLSGEKAHELGRVVYDVADSVSRLDLAVTVQSTCRNADLGRVVYDQAHVFRAEHHRAAAPWFIGHDDGGWTTYIGKRRSEAFFRLYDKHAECKQQGEPEEVLQYENAWRHELELKGQYAESVASRLYASDDEQAFTRQHVHRYLSDRGILPVFDPGGPTYKVAQLRRRSDTDRKLDWLTRSVAPTIAWLRDNGHEQSMLAALGLSLLDERPDVFPSERPEAV